MPLANLVILVPADNEEEWIGETLSSIPRALDGVRQVQVVVVGDGSRDATSQAALPHGAEVVIRTARHRGLSAAFRQGLDAALALGADLIVTLLSDDPVMRLYDVSVAS